MRLQKPAEIEQLVLPNEIVTRALSDEEVLLVAPEIPAWLVLTTAEWQCLQDIRSTSGNALARNSRSLNGSRSVIDDDTFDKLVAHGFNGSGAKEPTLPRLQLHITNACNLRCPHCYVSSGRPASNELSLSEWIELLDLYELPCHVSISGGERLCCTNRPKGIHLVTLA